MKTVVDLLRRRRLREDLTDRLMLCSRDELRVMSELLRRLEVGRERYGHLDLSKDSRDWRKEESEEHLDGAVYRACDYLSKEGARG